MEEEMEKKNAIERFVRTSVKLSPGYDTNTAIMNSQQL